MKKITVIAIATALILWGLVMSPQNSALVEKLKNKSSLSFLNTTPARSKLPENLAEDLKKVDSLLSELDQIKETYEKDLREYKKMDTQFTALIMKSRKHPNPELIKKAEAELDLKFQALTDSLKNYQEKSQTLYKFQTATLDMNI